MVKRDSNFFHHARQPRLFRLHFLCSAIGAGVCAFRCPVCTPFFLSVSEVLGDVGRRECRGAGGDQGGGDEGGHRHRRHRQGPDCELCNHRLGVVCVDVFVSFRVAVNNCNLKAEIVSTVVALAGCQKCR